MTLTLSHGLYGQPELAWIKTFGGSGYDVCYDHIQTPDGGFILAGYKHDIGEGCGFWLLKTNANGDSIWSRTYFYNQGGVCRRILSTEDGGYLLFGRIRGAPPQENARDTDLCILKVNANGDSLWSTVYGMDPEDDWTEWDEILAVIAIEGEGYAIAGQTESLGNGNFDIFLMLLDEKCDSLWMRTYGGRGDDECEDLIRTSSGGFLLTGTTSRVRNGFSDAFVIYVDDEGDSLWAVVRGWDRWDCYYSLIQVNDSLYCSSGYTQDVGYQDSNILCTFFNNQGRVINEFRYGERGTYKDESCRASLLYDANHIIITGYFSDHSDNRNTRDYIGLLKIDLSGNVIYSRLFQTDNYLNSVLNNLI